MATALEEAVVQLKGIYHGTGAPDYVFSAVNSIPAVFEESLIEIKGRFDSIAGAGSAIAEGLEKATNARR
jgi:hypothetical protein